MSQTALKTDAEAELQKYYPIRLNSIPLGSPLPYDVFVLINDKPVLFKKRGDVLTSERIKLLSGKGSDRVLVTNEDKDLYLNSIKGIIQDPSASTETKSKFLKEAAFIHVNDLFTKEDVAPVVTEATSLVEEMVQFISTDINAVTSLLRLSVHDYYTYNHCVDVAVYSIALAKRIFGEDKNLLMAAGLGGLLHDIGKRKIDYNIINKKSALTAEEWAEIKKHPSYGKEYLEGIDTVPDSAKLIVYEHHENFDGTGYPRGLKGEEIFKLTRLITIADVFDALTTNRSYHAASKPEDALNTMFGMQPGKFDPTLFKSFNKNLSKKSPFILPKDFDPCQPPRKFKIS